MDTFSLLSNEARPSEGSFALQTPTWNQEEPCQYAHCSHQCCGSAFAERRSLMASSHLIHSRKRPIRSLVAEHVQNAQASNARSPSPSRPLKRTKEPGAALSPRPQPLRADESANDTSGPLLQPSGPAKACAAEQHQRASLNYHSKSAGLRTLSSPIIIKGSHESFALNPNQDFMNHSALANPSKYVYYPPTNPSEGPHQSSRAQDGGPYRRLSYGASPGTPDPGVSHKITASPDPRRKATVHEKEKGCLCSYNQSPEAIHATSWNSKPSQPQPRLWLDLAEDEEIQERRAIAVTSSPCKPREILISSRGVTMKPTVCPDWESSTIVPGAAPMPGIGLRIEGFGGQKQEKRQQVFQRIKARNTLDMTTANSATTVRSTAHVPRPRYANPPPNLVPPLSESTTQILFDLDVILTSNASLHLSNPVIQKIRPPSARTEQPRTPPTIPLSRFSTFKPPPRPLSSQTPITPPDSASSAAHISTLTSSYPKTKPTIDIIRAIFPHAATSLLSTLHATYLAFHYVQNIPLPPQNYHPEENSTGISYIPSKARAMLGLQMPGRRTPLPSCWVRPYVEGMEWRERIEKVEYALRRELGRVLRECVGCHLGALVEEVMVRAMGEVVRLVEHRETDK